MVAGLGDTRGPLRRIFIESLSKVGIRAVPSLRLALLNHSNVNVRRSAAKTLKLIGDPSALPDLLEALINDPDPVVQGSSAGAMAIFGGKAVELLKQILINPNCSSMQRGLATWGIAFVGAEAPESIRKAAQSTHPEIRAAAIGALGDQIQSLEDKEAKKILFKSLEDDSFEVRAEACALLGKLQDAKWAEELLRKKLFDNQGIVRKNAALSLMQLKAINSIEFIEKIIITEANPDIIKVLELAISQLTDIRKKTKD